MLLNGDKILDPTYKILNFIQSQKKELLYDDDYKILFGNLQTHFLKLFYSVIHIHEIQKDNDFMNKYNQTSFVGTMLIEYPYIKISTIWDIAYQIAEKLTKLKNSKGNKYEQLEKEFINYAEKCNYLNLSWYKNINKIRNRIIHGGIKTTSLYLNKDNKGEIKNRLCFQLYDNQLNDLVVTSYYYTNKYNNNINFTDNYFALYTSMLYSYLIDFFDFILLKLCDEYNLNLIDFNKHDNSDLLELHGMDDKYWSIAYMEEFKCIAINMLKLYKNEGVHIGMDGININHLELKELFPILAEVD